MKTHIRSEGSVPPVRPNKYVSYYPGRDTLAWLQAALRSSQRAGSASSVQTTLPPAQPQLQGRGVMSVAHTMSARVVYGFLLIASLAGVMLPLLQDGVTQLQYQLTANEQALAGTTNANLAAKISFDPQTQQFEFNQSGIVQTAANNPVIALKKQLGGAGKKDSSLYSVDAPVDLSQGLTYYDDNLGLSFKLVPQFSTLPGREVHDQLVYPLVGGGTLVYSFKTNGLKEDVILTQPPATGTLDLDYRLQLPATLQARLVPQTGELGIYSADTALFGNISYGSSNDQALVARARANSPKTHLVFVLPPPIIKEAHSTNNTSSAHFTLQGKTLHVIAQNLSHMSYPLSIDPSIVITSSADFSSGNNDGDIAYPSGQINRANVSGGTVGSWSPTTSFTNGRIGFGAVAYNGYLYFMGGWNGSSAYSDVQFAQISSTGALVTTLSSCPGGGTLTGGTWCTTTVLPSARYGFGIATYNGYLYITGGTNGTTTYGDTQYAPINADGTIGSWTNNSNTYSTARHGQAMVAYNGYLYMTGGVNGSTYNNQVWYAPINADGSVGTWTSSANVFTTARDGHGSVAYNGYLYIMGGYNGSTQNDVQYAPINADGTVGTWKTTASFTTARVGLAAAVYNGYLYITGGYTLSVYLNDVQYAPIYANGSIGTWTTTTSFTTARYSHSAVAYNGYLYIMGGGGATYYSDVQYAAINPAGTTGSYTQLSSRNFTNARSSLVSIAYNGYLYVIGGWNGTTYYNDVQYATIGSGGSIGPWTTSTYTFTNGRQNFAAVAYNGYLYIMGGYDGSVRLNDVQYATIGSGGNVGPWTTSTNTFSGARDGLQAAAYNGHLYIMGGYNGGYLNDVQYATIGSGGSVGAWTTSATSTLNDARAYFQAVVDDNNIYVLGGVNGSTYYNNVEYAPINSDGTVGSWSLQTSTFTSGRAGLSAVAYDGYLYIMGGNAGGTVYGDVQYAPINANGTVGTWTTTASLPNVRSGLGVATSQGYMYLLGGHNGSTYYNDVQVAPINNGGSGTVGAWTTNATSFTTGRDGSTAVAYSGYLYVLGGYDGTTYHNDVQYAPINADGTVGTWTTSTNTFTDGRMDFAAVAYNGYLYIMGGYDGSVRLNDVQYAAIGSGGSVGSWTPGASFLNARSSGTAAAYNGYLYVYGGWNGTTYYNDVQYAPINANGSVGPWTTNATSFANARYALDGVVYNGYLYFAGGYDGTTYYNDVQYAPLSSIPRTASFSKLLDLGGNYLLTSITYNGSIVGGGQAIRYKIAGTNGTFGSLSTISSLSGGSTTQCPTGPNSGRYVWLSISLDDSSVGTFPDINGAASYITDVTVNYSNGHASPDLRLRGGAWFSNQALQPLDTCGP